MRQAGKAAIGALLAVIGCGRHKPFVDETRLDRGLVLVLPGIEGKGIHNRMIRDGLAHGGVPGAIEICDWTFARWLSFFYNLRAEARNRRKAAAIARRIEAYQRERPGRPVFLVGQSGGAAMAAFIAEALPDEHPVEGIVMLAAALSPDYPLQQALTHSRRGIVSSYSRFDMVYLGAGTTVFGTSDGRHRSAAGRIGFRNPQGAEAYRKLYQVPWRRDMFRQWNLGGHHTSGAGPFVEAFVAPLLQAEDWDNGVVASLAGLRGNARWGARGDGTDSPRAEGAGETP